MWRRPTTRRPRRTTRWTQTRRPYGMTRWSRWRRPRPGGGCCALLAVWAVIGLAGALLRLLTERMFDSARPDIDTGAQPRAWTPQGPPRWDAAPGPFDPDADVPRT